MCLKDGWFKVMYIECLERTNPREGDIGLTKLEVTCANVYQCRIKGCSLRFMCRARPRQPQRNLRACAEFILFNRPVMEPNRFSRPIHELNNGSIRGRTEPSNVATGSIHEPCLRIHICNEHHLSIENQFQVYRIGRIGIKLGKGLLKGRIRFAKRLWLFAIVNESRLVRLSASV